MITDVKERVVLRFTLERAGRTLNGSLTLIKADYAAMSAKEIQARLDDRFDKWIENIETVPVEPTKAEMLAEVEALDARKTELQAKIQVREDITAEVKGVLEAKDG